MPIGIQNWLFKIYWEHFIGPQSKIPHEGKFSTQKEIQKEPNYLWQSENLNILHYIKIALDKSHLPWKKQKETH